MQRFTDLKCWTMSREFRNECYNLTKEFSSNEKFRLADQLIRSSRSIGNSLAEGYGRYYFKENIQFCRISRGSLEESLDHLIIAKDLGYINQEKFSDLKSKVDRLRAVLNGYIMYLKKQRDIDK